MTNSTEEKIFKIALAAIIFFTCSIFFSWILAILWNNCLVPAVNGINQVSVLQMLGIYILCFSLFQARFTVRLSEKLEDMAKAKKSASDN